MTIRGGRNPRDDRGAAPERPFMAHRLDDAAPAPVRTRLWGGHLPRSGTVSASELAQRRGGGSGRAKLRFVLFLLLAGGLVLALLVTVGRPLVRGVVTGLAGENPSALGIGFVADMVREDLGPALTDPAGSAASDVAFVVEPGDTAATIAARLVEAGVLRDPRAFVLVSVERDVSTSYQAGSFVVRQTMTPDQLATALLTPPDPHILLSIRTGLRLEQIVALIEAKPADRGIDGLTMSAAAFLDLVRTPPASLLKDYPWLQIPKGGSLEGYLAGGDYRLLPNASPEDLVRMMLDHFLAEVGPDRMKVAASRGLTWSQVLTMASIVEREARLDSERSMIAGVLQNRLDPRAETAGFLGSDPTVFYVNDTLQLGKVGVAGWVDYTFWAPLEGTLPASIPSDLTAYNTYTAKGLPPGPVCTPTVISIDAALNPDTNGGYLYFLAKKDGTTVFAKTYAEHQKNIQTYGN
jgi:UPF0755 protein